MPKFLCLFLTFLSSITLYAQVLIDLDGNDRDFQQVVSLSEMDQPTLVITWADRYCLPCEKILDELQSKYSTLKEKYNLRVIVINVDSNKGNAFKDFYNMVEYNRSMGPFKSISEFVKEYEPAQKWEFEKYVDAYGDFVQSYGTDAPFKAIYINGLIYYHDIGFETPDYLRIKGYNSTSFVSYADASVAVISDILSSIVSSESYLDDNLLVTLKEFDPMYKRSVTRHEGLYLDSISLLSGEIRFEVTYKDFFRSTKHGMSTVFYKNGSPEEKVMFVDGVAEGTAMIFYENGQLRWIGEFLDSKLYGLWKGFYPDGKPMVENVWEEGNLLEVKYYNDPSGNSLDKGAISRGNGFRNIYDEIGNIEEIKEYENGVEIKSYPQPPMFLQEKPKVIFVQGAGFTMGSNASDDVSPAHHVTLSNFSIGKYEITVSQYRAFCEDTGHKMPDEPNWGWNDLHPMVNVTHDDAVAYCGWLSEKFGGNWRLPTEAEWEYAARGGIQSQGYSYSGGNDLDSVGWSYSDVSSAQPNAVGRKKGNELGIYDMSGNVYEWCSDWFGEYDSEPTRNPRGAFTGSHRVIRGGGWGTSAVRSWVVIRESFDPSTDAGELGFRVVLDAR